MFFSFDQENLALQDDEDDDETKVQRINASPIGSAADFGKETLELLLCCFVV